MKTALLSIALAVVASAPAVAPAQTRMINTASDQLARLPVNQQRSVLRRAVLDAGMQCPSVGGVVHQGPHLNMEMWTIHCGRSGVRAVFIGQDQTVQVRPCDAAYIATAHIPACAVPSPPPPPARRPPASRTR